MGDRWVAWMRAVSISLFTMAGKSKKKKIAENPDSASFQAEQEPKLAVTRWWSDPRTMRIMGFISLMVFLTLTIAFLSFLFTWQHDQSIVHTLRSSILLPSHDEPVQNLLGTLGAYLSYELFARGFGVGTFLLPTLFFAFGVNQFFRGNYFSVLRTLKYVVIGMPLIGLAAEVIFSDHTFPWGGAVGAFVRERMDLTIGKLGTYAFLVIASFSYVIWRFNPVFVWPGKGSSSDQPSDSPASPEEISPTVHFPLNREAETPVQVDADVPAAANTAPHDIKPLTSVPSTDPQFGYHMEVTEMPDPVVPPVMIQPAVPPVAPPIIPVTVPAEVTPPADQIALEIKPTPEPTPEPTVAPKIGSLETRYDPILDLRDYKYPTLDLLESGGSDKIIQDPAELESNKNQIIHTLQNYDIQIQRISATVGPTVTLYEIVPAAGIRISRIKNLEDDIALSLAALGIRIIAPIPGKGTIGIEVPNTRKTVVRMQTLLASEKFQTSKFALPIALGKKIDNENFIVDLASMPHLLMAGATGQGKSVGLNAILVSLLYKKHPSQLKFVLVDPKKVELSIYKTIENHFLAKLPGEEDAIITDTKKVINTLNALCIEMDSRYDLLKDAGCRNIREYNEKFAQRKLSPEKGHQYLPFIVLVVDEFADLIMTAGKEVEMPIARLAQLARAVGIHLIIATQRPSVNIITGTIKANFPARIAFKVSSKIDSRTILDIGGAEQLIGKGDMLISYNGELVRLQCAFVDTPEVDQVAEFIGNQRGYPHAFLLPEYVDEKDQESRDFDLNDRDSLFEEAARLIVANQMGSTSLIQRRMKLGYNRAGRLMDQLESAGVVGPNQGSKAREVLIKTDADLQRLLDEMI